MVLNMPKKISNETKQLIEELYAQNLPIVEVARRTNVSYATAYGYTKAKQKGFASRAKYQEDLARRKGFASYKEYQKYLAKQRGFASRAEYQKNLAKERQQRQINQKLSHLMQQRLTELGKTQRWLSEQLGITEGSVSRYLSGKTIPRKILQEKLFSALELSYKTLDDLLE